jgi:hypothetical protein
LQFLFTSFPHADHDRARGNTAALLFRCLLFSFSEMLLDPLEQGVDLFADVFAIEFLDNFL